MNIPEISTLFTTFRDHADISFFYKSDCSFEGFLSHIRSKIERCDEIFQSLKSMQELQPTSVDWSDELRANDEVLTTVFSTIYGAKMKIQKNKLNLQIVESFYTRLAKMQTVSQIFLGYHFWKNVDGTKFGQAKQIEAFSKIPLQELIIQPTVDVDSLVPEEMFLINILQDWNFLREERT